MGREILNFDTQLPGGVILTGAVFQAEGRISRVASYAGGPLHARSLDPLVRARVFGMTPSRKGQTSEMHHHYRGLDSCGRRSRFVPNLASHESVASQSRPQLPTSPATESNSRSH